MAKKLWKNRQLKDIEKTDKKHRPNMCLHPNGLAYCYFPPDGDVTSSFGVTEEEAFRKWEALTSWYEQEQRF